MHNKAILWIFPLLSQLTFFLLTGVFGHFSLTNFAIVFCSVSIPAFFFALICVKFNYHRQHLFPIAFFSGLIFFLYGLIIIPFAISKPETDISLIEHSLMLLLYTFSYALAAMMYALLYLRLFLRKRSSH